MRVGLASVFLLMLSGAFHPFNGALRSLSGAFRLASGFLDFGNEFCQTVKNEIFCPLYIIMRVSKQQDLGNEFCQMVGDALKIHPFSYPIRDENGSDTNGYHRYHICFRISGRIRIRIRIMSTMSDKI